MAEEYSEAELREMSRTDLLKLVERGKLRPNQVRKAIGLREITGMDVVKDQPMPKPAGGPAMQDLVIADIEERKAIGIERYGQLLKAHTGRDPLIDAYQEALDLCIYLRQVVYERDHPKPHAYELPDTSIDPPCAICGKQPEEHQ